jgi:hypothetical protein
MDLFFLFFFLRVCVGVFDVKELLLLLVDFPILLKNEVFGVSVFLCELFLLQVAFKA